MNNIESLARLLKQLSPLSYNKTLGTSLVSINKNCYSPHFASCGPELVILLSI